MNNKKQVFKKPAKKHEPRGLEIIYEDKDIIVVNKSSGLLTIATNSERTKTAHFRLNEYVKKGNPKSRNRVFIVHRLDKDTSGVLVFAKSEKVKHYLQDEWGKFNKKYFAVIHGCLDEKEGLITSYLAENKAYRMYSVKEPSKGKLSKTRYTVLKESHKYSLLEIELLTGRKNQIRVHLAELGHPIVGDKIYGFPDKNIKRLALHSAELTILHPFTKEKNSFKTSIPRYFNSLIKDVRLEI